MSHAQTAAATRDALARLWLPPQEVLDMVASALALDCLSDDARHWLRRMQNEQRRQQKDLALTGEVNGLELSDSTNPSTSYRRVDPMTSKERPILFSGEMVRAILDGRKTQTRRVVKPQPDEEYFSAMVALRTFARFWTPGENPNEPSITDIKCPYGVPGDRLWGREAHVFVADGPIGIQPGIAYRADGHIVWRDTLPDGVTVYNAGKPHIWKWRPSTRMPRWASRITLENTRVDVLQAAEDGTDDGGKPYKAGDWLWVVEFKRIEVTK